jgi:hypothetical protein
MTSKGGTNKFSHEQIPTQLIPVGRKKKIKEMVFASGNFTELVI